MSDAEYVEELFNNLVEIQFSSINQIPDEIVGAGRYGVVTRGIIFNNTEVCLKKFEIGREELQEYLSELKDIQREMTILQSVTHSNIMQFYGFAKHINDEGMTDLYLVSEYVQGGNLRNLLRRSETELSWMQRTQMALDVATALSYLHDRKIVHRDLKSVNLLVDDDFRIKLCDFGFARTLMMFTESPSQTATTATSEGKPLVSRRNLQARRLTVCGTEEWMAPEMLLGQPYDEKVDLFSFGIVLIEIITRKRPDQIMKKRDKTKRFAIEAEEITALLAAESTPKPLIDIVLKCCSFSPNDRGSIALHVEALKSFLNECQTKMVSSESSSGSSLQPPPQSGDSALKPSPALTPSSQWAQTKAKTICRICIRVEESKFGAATTASTGTAGGAVAAPGEGGFSGIDVMSCFAIEGEETGAFLKRVVAVLNGRVENGRQVAVEDMVLCFSLMQMPLTHMTETEQPFLVYTTYLLGDPKFCFYLCSRNWIQANNNTIRTSTTTSSSKKSLISLLSPRRSHGSLNSPK